MGISESIRIHEMKYGFIVTLIQLVLNSKPKALDYINEQCRYPLHSSHNLPPLELY